MKLILASLLLLVANLAAQPNIVYVIADDLGYGDVHCLNPQRGKIATPNADKLAAQGITFTDAHSGSSVCTPTRYGVLTGRYAWRTRLQSGVLSDYVEPLIAAERFTVPALLQRHGYHTACIGKWHLGFTVDAPSRKNQGAPLGARTADGPLTRGFNHFYGFHHARMMKSVFQDDRVTEIVEPVDMLPKLTRHAADYIAARAKTGKPFFLYFALNSPHTPIVPSPAWDGKSGLGKYGDFVMETDWALGEIVAALDKAGIAGNTLLIFTSDNGCSAPAAGVDKLERQGHYPSAQFRGYKSDIWDGGHRIPFMIRWPGVAKPGATCAQLTCLTDLMATAADILGTKLPDNAGEDSVSILPLLKGEGRPVREAVVHHSINGMFSIRQGNTKLILGTGSGGWSKGGDGAPAQLYNMANDIGEQKNLQAADKETVQRLTKLMERYVSDGRSNTGTPQRNDVAIQLWKRGAKRSE
ncbi:MAG: arylsulfatase [Verrucomicrobia bacterium]|nr:arylsulfatase [Verrucomicrobiota bacterium]